MSPLRPLVSALGLCACCIALNGCIVAAIGGAAGGGYAVAQSSGASGGWNDGNIKNAIEDRWNETDPQIAHAVNLDVFQGRVMLTGDVPSPAVRDEAVADAWKVEGVTDVINELKIGGDSSFGQDTTDTWIQTQLRSALTFDNSVSGTNYVIEAEHGVVYILGTAADPGERERVLNHARNLANVRRVVSHIRVGAEAPMPAANRPPPPPPFWSPPPDQPPPMPEDDTAPPSGMPQQPYAPPPPQQPYAPPSQPYTPPPANSHPITIQPLP
ncbi:MAG: BON domain-containing protein [Aliidongia sp.]